MKEESPHEPQYCGAKNRQGEPCKRYPVHGRNRCNLHGGKSLVGSANGRYKSGRYSTFLPGRLGQRYLAMVGDAELTNMRHEIALLDVMLGEVMAGMFEDGGDTPQLWLQLQTAWGSFRDAQNAGDVAAMHKFFPMIEKYLDQGATAAQRRGEVRSLIRDRRQLVESEQRRVMQMEQTVTVEQLMVVIGVIVEIVHRYITDTEARANIAREIHGMVQGEAARVLDVAI